MLPPSTPSEALPELVAEINITPLTDVFLVLLIIFMVSSSAMVDAAHHEQLQVSLPSAGASKQGEVGGGSLVVGVSADGTLVVDGQSLPQPQLMPLLEAAHRRAPHSVVIVDADGSVAHRHVVAVMDAIKVAGFTTVAIGAQSSDIRR